MSTEEEIISELPIIKSKDFKIESIQRVNHRPHPYCITPKHLEGDSMYLDENAIIKAEENGARCGMYENGDSYANGFKPGYSRCTHSYKEHKSDFVMFLRATVPNKTPKELLGVTSWFKKAKPIMEKHKIDGVAFIEYQKPTKKSKAKKV